MSILPSALRSSLALALCASLAAAQSFNLDVGDPMSAGGVPADTYGAAASQPGVWNTACDLNGYMTNLVDLSGMPTTATVSALGGGGDFEFDNVFTVDPDDEALLDDIKCGITIWTFDGLLDGTYDIYTYAWAPDNGFSITQVAPMGAMPATAGGMYPGMHTEGVSYTLHTGVVVTGGTLVVDVTMSANFTSTNGFQFVVTAGAFAEGCSGDGGNQAGCTDCPCGNNAMAGTVGGCINSAGTSTRLLPSGSRSIMAADLRFEASGAPPNNSAVLTSGNALAPANAANPCFGLDSGVQSVSLDGLRCAVQGVLRHGVRPSDANGDIGVTTNGWGTPNGFFNFAAFAVGDTKHFQIIHRDDSLAVCGTGQNTSQAVSATFEP